MYAIQSLVRKSPKLMQLAVSQRRTVVGVPPTIRFSFPEKVLHGFFMWASIMAVPIYVTYHLPQYRGDTKE